MTSGTFKLETERSPVITPASPVKPAGPVSARIRSTSVSGSSRAIKIHSFDVFDTALIRLVGDPRSMFLLLGRRLAAMSLIVSTPEAFARTRVEAYRQARLSLGEKVTLPAIYAVLGEWLDLTEMRWSKLMELEQALEGELLRPVPRVRDKISQARKDGRVAFVSDTYFSSTFIQGQLAHHGLWNDDDKCYVSCANGRAKATGALFHELIRDAGGAENVSSHIGNSLGADVHGAARAGLRAEYFASGNPNRYERILETYASLTEGLTSVMAGASRFARLSLHAPSAREETIRDVSASVISPAMAGYVLWMLNRAKKLGLRRLYFISRDGQTLREVAQKFASRLGIDCELRYLYASRRAWRFPAFSTEREGPELLPVSMPFYSVRSVLSWLSLGPEEITRHLTSIGLPDGDWSRNLGATERLRLHTLLERDQTVRALILERAESERHTVARYLDQEGVLDGADAGLVAAMSGGSEQAALRRLVLASGGRAPVWFYFGLTSRPETAGYELGPYESYFLDERRGRGFVRRIPNVRFLIEMFCSGDHGQVMGYLDEEGQIRPKLKEEFNSRGLEWGLGLARATVSCFADTLLVDPSVVNVWADVRAPLAEVLRRLWLNPSALEARALGAFSVEDSPTADHWFTLATAFHPSQVARMLLRSDGDRPPAWFPGSLALSNPLVRVIVKGSRKARRVGRRGAHIYRRLVRA